MTNEEIEIQLKRLGEVARPPDSLLSNVMRQIRKKPAHGMALSSPLRRGRSTHAMIALAAIAACLVAATFVMKFRNSSRSHVQRGIAINETSYDSIEFPTVADYRRAYAESPEAFEALFNPPPGTSAVAREPLIGPRDILRPDLNLN